MSFNLFFKFLSFSTIPLENILLIWTQFPARFRKFRTFNCSESLCKGRLIVSHLQWRWTSVLWSHLKDRLSLVAFSEQNIPYEKNVLVTQISLVSLKSMADNLMWFRHVFMTKEFFFTIVYRYFFVIFTSRCFDQLTAFYCSRHR